MSLTLNIQKQCGPTSLDISMDTCRGVHGLLGISGAGKSMTLKCIAGIETPDKGRIVLYDRVLFDSELGINLPPQQRKVGYLFQHYALFPTMTVFQNIASGCLTKAKKQRLEEVSALLSTFQLEHLAQKYPHQLSGGEQQRVALARILASQPEALLLDEPLSALDSFLKWQIEWELLDFLKSFPHPVLFVSHSQEEIAHLCQQVWVISHGKSQAKTTPHNLFHHPQTVDACLLSGCKNFSPVTVEDGTLYAHHWGCTLSTPVPPPVDTTHVAIHGYRLQMVDCDGYNTVCCGVNQVIDGGSRINLLVTPHHGSTPLQLEVPPHQWNGQKDEIFVHFPPEDLLIFST